MFAESTPVRIGVLALQGSFREHMAMLNKLHNVQAFEVRTKEELDSCAGLIIPGGESTTMALVAERWGLLPELQTYAKAGKPIWGTCAGMIFLAEKAEGQKQGGQTLLGGLDITVSRNFFGAQVDSFETYLPAPDCLKKHGSADTFRAVFIRAPAVLSTGPEVEPLAVYRLTSEEAASASQDQVVVAVRKQHLLATAFHPELTTDTRWHAMFVDMVRQQLAALKDALPGAPAATPDESSVTGRAPTRPADLPVFGTKHMEVHHLP